MNFRHLLEQHQLARQLFKTINRWLAEAGVMMTQGTLVDATIIEAPSSNKNKEQQRDPEMHQTKKGNQWHFGMKAHIGVDIHPGQPVSGGPNDTSVVEISVKTGNNARNGGKNSLNRLIRCVCGKKIGPDNKFTLPLRFTEHNGTTSCGSFVIN